MLFPRRNHQALQDILQAILLLSILDFRRQDLTSILILTFLHPKVCFQKELKASQEDAQWTLESVEQWW